MTSKPSCNLVQHFRKPLLLAFTLVFLLLVAIGSSRQQVTAALGDGQYPHYEPLTNAEIRQPFSETGVGEESATVDAWQATIDQYITESWYSHAPGIDDFSTKDWLFQWRRELTDCQVRYSGTTQPIGDAIDAIADAHGINRRVLLTLLSLQLRSSRVEEPCERLDGVVNELARIGNEMTQLQVLFRSGNREVEPSGADPALLQAWNTFPNDASFAVAHAVSVIARTTEQSPRALYLEFFQFFDQFFGDSEGAPSYLLSDETIDSVTYLMPFSLGERPYTGGPHAVGSTASCADVSLSDVSGIDFGRPDVSNDFQNAVIAIAEGEIVGIKREEGVKWQGGRWVAVQHDNGVVSMYWHLSSVNEALQLNQRINAGAYLGDIGDSGCSPDCPVHIHVDLRAGGNNYSTWTGKGTPVPWTDRVIDGWLIYPEVNASGKAENYNGTALRLSAINASYQKEIQTNCGEVIAAVENGFPHNDETNTENTKFAYEDRRTLLTSTNGGYCPTPTLTNSSTFYNVDGLCGSDDTTPPSATGFSASVSEGRYAEISTSGVQDNSGGSGVKEVRFSAKWGGSWYGIGTDSSAPYALTWDMCSSNVPNGDVELGMEVWDNAGNKWVWTEDGGYANPHVTKQNNCDAPPSDKVRIYEHPNYTSIMHAWQDAGRFNVPDNANEKASSIWIENGWSVRVYDNPNQEGENKCFTGSVLNLSDVGFDNRISSVEIFHQSNCPLPPKPDLQPFTPSGWEYPVVPNSSAQPTQATTALYAGGYPGRDVMTFFDWAFTNSGSGTANGDFHVEVRIDDTWFIRYPYRDVGPGGGANWENWMHPVLTPGQHVLKIVVDPDNRIAESNENNNEWQHTFNWQPISGWYAEYYSNESLTWPPEVVRDDAEINFSWSGSPAPNIPANGFSVRWARTDNFSAGTYRFSGYQDDGARVQIDGTTYYEKWTDPTVSPFTFDKALTPGQHTVMFEMYEHSGGAEAELSWELLAPTGPGIPSLDRPPDGIVFDRSAVINLIWFTSHDAKHYYATLSGGPDVNRNSGWVLLDTFWIAGQLPGGSYQWKVKARNLDGVESAYSQTRSFTVEYGPPTHLAATAESSTQIDLSWDASADAPANIDGYRIYRNGSAIATVSSATTTYANTGLNCETGYTYVVRAYKGSVESDASNSASATTTSCSLAAPDVNPIYNPDSDGTFRIVWSAFPGATWYVAEQRRDNGAWEPSYSGDGEWYEVTDYSVGEWCFRVQAETSTSTSPWSSTVCTQVGEITEPPSIPILSAIGNPYQANAYWVSWANASGASEYELQEKWNWWDWSTVYSGSSVSFYASGKAEGNWCYRVRALNSVGTSDWSDLACTTVQGSTYSYQIYIVSIMK